MKKWTTRLIDEDGELYVQRHALHCLWLVDRGKVHLLPAWSSTSLIGLLSSTESGYEATIQIEIRCKNRTKTG